MWPEIEQSKANHRFEVKLSGPAILARVKEQGFDESLFSLEWLKAVEISGIGLPALSSKCSKFAHSADINVLRRHQIAQLCDLLDLILSDNKLEELPAELGALQKLRTLSVRKNSLKSVPASLGQVKTLHTLNLSFNQLTTLPDELASLKTLTVLDISGNHFDHVPPCVFGMHHLSDLLAQQNAITVLDWDVGQLEQLKAIDLSNNQLQTLPAALANCLKLKEVSFRDNPFKEDRRLGKLVQAGKCKPIVEYVRTAGLKQDAGKKQQTKAVADTSGADEPSTSTTPAPVEKGGKKPKSKAELKAAAAASAAASEDKDLSFSKIIRVYEDKEHPLMVNAVVQHTKEARPHIACCIVRGVSLEGQLFDWFIDLQTRLHQEVCGKRALSTIATHDNDSITWPLTHDGRPPTDIHIVPLREIKEIKVLQLLRRYQQEEGPMQRYCKLVADQGIMPCLFDQKGRCMSFPPFTNADYCKISPQTKDVFIEITSSVSLDECRKAMDALLVGMLNLGICTQKPPSLGAEGGSKIQQILEVQVVRVVDEKVNLRCMYPARTDLGDTHAKGVGVIRR